VPDGLADWFVALMDKAPPPPEPGAPELATVRYHVLGNAETAARAAVEEARSLGVEGVVHLPRIDGETEAAARRILEELEQAPEGLHAWAGETTVRLPPSPGQGGRSRHLALCLALAIAGRSDRLFLCAGTDAGDGPGDVAGGWADGHTLRRGETAGRDAHCDMAAADSGRFLAAAGDEFVTGPTGTNVTDLVLAWKGAGGLSSTGDRG
jgi:hydroxypyruvate reductase